MYVQIWRIKINAEKPRRTQYTTIEVFCAGATAIGKFWGATAGIAISGWVFFCAERNGSGISGIRTVSLFGPGGGAAEAGRAEAASGFEAVGGLGGAKKLLDEMSSGGDCGDEETEGPPVSRTGN
jgi:hypothetical protein